MGSSVKLCNAKRGESVASTLGRLSSFCSMVGRLSPVVASYKGNPAFEFRGKIGGVGCHVHRLSRFATQPLIQLIGRCGYISPLSPDGHTLHGPPLHDGSRLSQKTCNLLPAFEVSGVLRCSFFADWFRHSTMSVSYRSAALRMLSVSQCFRAATRRNWQSFRSERRV